MHHYTQIAITKLFILASISIFHTPPPPSYQRLVWDYKEADSKNIRKALDSVNWERLFDQKAINAQVTAFNETILNVFWNYVPNKYITIDDKDPVWMNENIKTKIKEKIHSTKSILRMEDLKVTSFFLKN